MSYSGEHSAKMFRALSGLTHNSKFRISWYFVQIRFISNNYHFFCTTHHCLYFRMIFFSDNNNLIAFLFKLTCYALDSFNKNAGSINNIKTIFL